MKMPPSNFAVCNAAASAARPSGGRRSHASFRIYDSRENGMESLCPDGRSVWPNWS